MPINWSEILSNLGSTAIVVGVIAWLAKAIVTHLLTRDVEGHKATLNYETDLAVAKFNRNAQSALLEQKSEFDRKMLELQTRTTRESAQIERIRQAIEQSANPILGAVRD